MSESDNFRDGDRTIIRPSPGGRQRPQPFSAPAQTPYTPEKAPPFPAVFPAGSNPLIDQAFSLISIVPKLRNLAYHHAVDDLQDQLVREIRSFEERCLRQGVLAEQVKTAGYFLCVLLDETVMNTPWGNQSNWGHNSLLVQFYNEAWGGERFFAIIDRLKQNPSQNTDLLELAYLCLSMGFQGKYRVAGGGIREIEQLRQDLYRFIHGRAGDSDKALSPRWQGLREMRSPFARHVPLWVVSAVAGALMMLMYLGFAYAINRNSDAVYQRLAALSREQVLPQPARLPARPFAPSAPIRENRFRRLLSAEIAAGRVEVLEGDILRIANAFAAGSDQVRTEYIPMLTQIARELQTNARRALVVGHTDSSPIFSARFPSNWHLSQARAKNVADALIAAAGQQARIDFEGRADSEPLVANDTAENRARNRRIEIRIR